MRSLMVRLSRLDTRGVYLTLLFLGKEALKVVIPRMTSNLRDQSRSPSASSVSSKGSTTLQWDQIKEEIVQWLKPPDPSTNYDMARRIRHKGTAEWFLRGNIFEKWKSEGSLFWVHGMRTFIILLFTIRSN